MHSFPARCRFACFALASALAAPLLADEPAKIDFARQIRPILSAKCWRCHGPDAAERQAAMRLDLRPAALAPTKSGATPIVPGDPAASELVRRIDATDADTVMPPPKSNLELSADQRQLLRDWIAQGAAYAEHWSFVAPVRPPLPAVRNANWPQGAIDRFILHRLEQSTPAAEPSPAADRITLLRRLSLDLTGLPPTIAEVDAFLGDTSPQAYERVVDTLLASPHYGERMAQEWLDLARFGDTNGYQDDAYRSMWPYRDYVIRAFNANMRFDQFTIENLAGDLLAGATIDQRVASGFNRNHRHNEEGGSDPEEFLVVYAVDRTATTGAVWLGLTLGCAQCHDHKFDPVSQREFYQLYAFFNSIKDEVGISNKAPDAIPPLIRVPSAEQQTRLTQLEQQIAQLTAAIAPHEARIAAAQAAWEQTAAAAPNSLQSSAGAAGGLVARSAAKTYYADPRIAEPLTLGHAVKAAGEFVMSGSGNHDVNVGHMSAAPTGQGNYLGFSVAEGPRVFAYVGLADGTRVASNALPLELNVVYTWSYVWEPAGGADDPADPDGDGEGLLKLELFHDDASVGVRRVDLDAAQRAIGLKLDAFGIANRGLPGPGEGNTLYIDEVRYTIDARGTLREESFGADPGWTGVENRSAGSEFGFDPLGGSRRNALANILAIPRDRRTPAQAAELRSYYLTHFEREHQTRVTALAAAERERAAVEKSLPTTLVMESPAAPRPAFVLARGDFLQRGEQVSPDVPKFLPPLADGPRDRLALARWLMSDTHPLTARVTANRLWKQFFGMALVRTMDDFGSQGEYPSHPELLDWLARELVESGWNLKALQKQIVMSAAYRQSSRYQGRTLALDAENRLLARAPRYRLSAEEIRDSALAISGLLDRRLGGASVFPAQPAGYYADKSKDWHWNQSSGGDAHRRGLYTFVRRTTPYPAMQTFDAPSRELCTVQRARTNTPLQALVTLNDPVFVEAAHALGARIAKFAGTNDERLGYGFRLAVARRPRPAELATLRGIFDRQLAHFRADPAAARLLVAGAAQDADVAELAAWTALGNVLLNLDETITRE